MAPDGKYYIRAGAHTVPASHYIVESLWARRRHQRPQLAHAFRPKPEASDVIQLAIIPLTDEPAVNVKVSLDPLPELWKESKDTFPIALPVLDRTTPFFLDVTTFFQAGERLGNVRLEVSYESISGNPYQYRAELDVRSISPWRMGTPATEKIARSLELIEKTLNQIPKQLSHLHEEHSDLRGLLQAWKAAVLPARRGGPSSLDKLLSEDAKHMLISAGTDGFIRFSPYIGGTQISAGGRVFVQSGSTEREVMRWKSAINELRDRDLVDGVFFRGTSSLFRLTNLGYELFENLKPQADSSTHETNAP